MFKLDGIGAASTSNEAFYTSDGTVLPQSTEGAQLIIGGQPVTKVTFVNSGELKAEAPANTKGSSEVSLELPDEAPQKVAGPEYKDLPKLGAASASVKRLRIPFVVDSSEFRTNLGVNNLSEETATVALHLLDNNGLEIAAPGKQITVPAYGMTQINNVGRVLEDASSITGREAYLIVESEQEIRAWASQIDNLTEDPSMERSQSDADGSQRVLVPSSAAIGQFLTSLIVINQSDFAGQVTIRSRSNAGVLQGELVNQSIEANGFLHFADFYGGLGLSNLYGPIEVEALGGIQITATARIYTQEGSSGYFQGVDISKGSKKVVMPFAVDNDDFRTNLGLTNPGASMAGVLVSLIDSDGLTRGSLSTTVSPYGMTQINKINEELTKASGTGTLEEGYLILESDVPIVGWTSQIDNLTQDLSMVVGKSADTSDTKLLIPSTASTGSFTSTFVAVNLSSLVNTVEITSRDINGNETGSVRITIPPKGLISFGDVLASFGQSGTYGPLEIESIDGLPILAVSRVSTLQRTGGYLSLIHI